jgi:hypothetical protein
MNVRDVVRAIERMIRTQQKNSCRYAICDPNLYDFLMDSLLRFFLAVCMTYSKGKTIENRESKQSYQKSFNY